MWDYINVVKVTYYTFREMYTWDSFACFEAMSSFDKASFVLGNELWEEHFESLLAIVKAYYIIDVPVSAVWEERLYYGNIICAQQPSSHSLTGDIAGVSGQNSRGMRQGGKPGTGKFYTEWLCPLQWVVGRWSWCCGGALSIKNTFHYSHNKNIIAVSLQLQGTLYRLSRSMTVLNPHAYITI